MLKTRWRRSLKAAVQHQMAAAADHILRLLTEAPPPEPELLRRLVSERVSAAVEEILTAFRASRAADREQEVPGNRVSAADSAGTKDFC